MSGQRRVPITQAGRVVYNGRLDMEEIYKRVSDSQMMKNLYAMGIPEDQSISKGELCLYRKTNQASKIQLLNVFSSLNGAFTVDEDMTEIMKDLDFAGIALGIVKYTGKEEKEYAPGEMTALQIGGLTTIINTGLYDISVGDLIYWVLPNPRDEIRLLTMERKTTKLRIPICPYNKNKMLNKQSFIDKTWENNGERIRGDGSRLDVASDSYNLIREAVLQIAVTTLVLAMKNGLIYPVGYDCATDLWSKEKMEKLTEESDPGRLERNEIASIFRAQVDGEDMVVALSKALGLADTTNVTITTPIGSGPKRTDYVRDLLLTIAANHKYLLIRPETDGEVTKMPQGIKGTCLGNQLNTLDNLHRGIVSNNEEIKRRTIGKAFSPAKPNAPFDIQLGGYCVNK